MPASASARSTTEPSACTWARLASSGTTPPKIRCTSCERIDEPGELGAPRPSPAQHRRRGLVARGLDPEDPLSHRRSGGRATGCPATRPGRRAPRGASTRSAARPSHRPAGPVHHHRHAVRARGRRAAPPARAPAPRPWPARGAPTPRGRSAAAPVPAVSVRSPTASIAHPHRHARPAVTRTRPNPAESSARVCSTGPSACASPRAARSAPSRCARSLAAGRAAGPSPAPRRWRSSTWPGLRPGSRTTRLRPAPPAGRWSRAPTATARGCTSCTCTVDAAGQLELAGAPRPARTSSPSVVSGRMRVSRIGAAVSLSSSRRGPVTSARTGPLRRRTERARPAVAR